VDAADLHLLLPPTVQKEHVFRSGNEAVIRQDDCLSCGACLSHCRFGAIQVEGGGAGTARYRVDPVACEGCGVCVRFCPLDAIDFPEAECGRWFVSDTRAGPMVHARLHVAAENSGKLVTTVRREAQRIALESGRRLIIADGPPGIGCPVIASLTGASLVLVVTEPTVSGAHDLVRVLTLARHFRVAAAVCVNKWDLNPDMADRIEREAVQVGAAVAGRIAYDPAVTSAQLAQRTAVEQDCRSGKEIVQLWSRVKALLDEQIVAIAE
jgi:MinD superfamily P-loop ATPase